MKHTYEEEIRLEIERSKKALDAAKKLFEEELLQDAISRSYYSVLHATKAVLLGECIMVDSHEAVKRLFGMYLVKTGKWILNSQRFLEKNRTIVFWLITMCHFHPK